MADIEVDDRTYDALQLLARAWNVGPAEALGRLIAAFAAEAADHLTHPTGPIEVHAIYASTRVDATYDPTTRNITVRSGPLAGRVFASPSGARAAVVTLLNPAVAPNGNGWAFWTVTSTGARLNTLR